MPKEKEKSFKMTRKRMERSNHVIDKVDRIQAVMPTLPSVVAARKEAKKGNTIDPTTRRVKIYLLEVRVADHNVMQFEGDILHNTADAFGEIVIIDSGYVNEPIRPSYDDDDEEGD